MTETPSPSRSVWRRRATALALYLLAVACGLGSAWWVLRKAPWSAHVIQVGPWQGSTLTGSTEADMYTRARVAIEGLLALGRDETMYYVARTDSSGQPLRSRCSYRVQGPPPKARWWSITAYADDYFLFDAPNRQYSLNGTTARLDARGWFELQTGQQPDASVHWLPTPGDRGLVLTLRLYHPEPDLQAAPSRLVAPTIALVGACS